MSSVQENLTDLISKTALQEIQDGFSSVTGLKAVIVDAKGCEVTSPSGDSGLQPAPNEFSSAANNELEGFSFPLTVPITVNGEKLGGIVLNAPAHPSNKSTPSELPGAGVGGVRFMYLLADALGQLCWQGISLRVHAQQMKTLYDLSTLLAGKHDLQEVLDAVAASAVKVMGAKAASIRLLDDAGKELIPTAVYNLSQKYLDKGPILLAKSKIALQAFDGEVVYVQDMASDDRVLYPNDAKREGLGSIIAAAMVYRGRNVGVMRIYTAGRREFSDIDKSLLQAIAQLSAGAIENVRLQNARREAQRIQRQVKLAADVQRHMMPLSSMRIGQLDIAARYEPCFELGGDFFDLIKMENSLGLVIGDVVGKGVAASLLMASVRSSLRAHAEDVYDLDEVMSKVNSSLCRDTRDNEFATVFYGTLDTQTLRLTYCSAGHDPVYLLRSGEFIELQTGGMVLGVDSNQKYDKGLIGLESGDVLLIYTDGVCDALNYDGKKFSRDRIKKAMTDMADQDAQTILNHVLWEVRRFIGLNSRTDDITLLAVKVE